MAATLVRTFVLYITVIISLRLMGKRQIGELQPGELVITILISECAAAPIQDLNRPVINGIMAILVLVILELLISAVALKWPVLRRLTDGHPVIIIRDGIIDQKALKNLRLSVNDLMEELRVQGYFFIQDIAFAIVETNGVLSVMLKPEKQTATAYMVNNVQPYVGMPCIVVNDGCYNKAGMSECGVNKDDIIKYLKNKRLKLKDVLLMTANEKKELIHIKKEAGI